MYPGRGAWMRRADGSRSSSVDVSDQKRAMDRRVADADWATIGRRIVRAAAMATAVHVTEHEEGSGRSRTEESDVGVQDGPRL